MRRISAFAALIALLACAKADEQIKGAVVAWLRAYHKGKEVDLAALDYIQRGDRTAVVRARAFDWAVSREQPTLDHVLYLTSDSGWNVQCDLVADFENRVLKDATAEEERVRRMGTRVRDMLNRSIEVPRGLSQNWTVAPGETEVQGSVEVLFPFEAEKGKFLNYLYQERFLFKNGSWEFQDGHLFLSKPPNARRP